MSNTSSEIPNYGKCSQIFMGIAWILLSLFNQVCLVLISNELFGPIQNIKNGWLLLFALSVIGAGLAYSSVLHIGRRWLTEKEPQTEETS